MAIKRTFIQQLSFDGTTYKKGPVVNLLDAYHIAAEEIPFKRFPDAKDLAARDWPGEDGRDIYIPSKIPIKSYELEARFVYKGTIESINKDITNFIDFIYGRNEDAIGGRLAIYDEYTGIGRKDVHVISIDNDVYESDENDPDSVASFKVKFEIEDPTTDVLPTLSSSPASGDVVNDLTFEAQ